MVILMPSLNAATTQLHGTIYEKTHLKSRKIIRPLRGHCRFHEFFKIHLLPLRKHKDYQCKSSYL